MYKIEIDYNGNINFQQFKIVLNKMNLNNYQKLILLRSAKKAAKVSKNIFGIPVSSNQIINYGNFEIQFNVIKNLTEELTDI